jgi:hypothetical protein
MPCSRNPIHFHVYWCIVVTLRMFVWFSAVGYCTIPVAELSGEATPSWFPLVDAGGRSAGTIQLSIWYQRPATHSPGREHQSASGGLLRSVYRSTAASVLRRTVANPVARSGSHGSIRAMSGVAGVEQQAPGTVAGVSVGNVALDVDSTMVPVTITSTSPDCLVSFGEPLRLEVVATGTSPLTYQWCMELDEFGSEALDGETSSTLSMAEFHDNFAGVYFCRVTNPCGTVVSRRILVTLKPVDPVVSPVGSAASLAPSPSPMSVLSPVRIASISDDC